MDFFLDKKNLTTCKTLKRVITLLKALSPLASICLPKSQYFGAIMLAAGIKDIY